VQEETQVRAPRRGRSEEIKTAAREGNGRNSGGKGPLIHATAHSRTESVDPASVVLSVRESTRPSFVHRAALTRVDF
jgi:hypothetical protein